MLNNGPIRFVTAGEHGNRIRMAGGSRIGGWEGGPALNFDPKCEIVRSVILTLTKLCVKI